MIHGTRCIPLLRQSTDTDWLSEKRTLRRCRVGGWGGESGEEELSWRSTSTADRFSRDRDDTRIPRSLASAWPRSSGPRSVCSVPMGPHTSLHYTTLPLYTTRLPTQIIVYDSNVPLDCVNESLYTVVNNLRLHQEVLLYCILQFRTRSLLRLLVMK